MNNYILIASTYAINYIDHTSTLINALIQQVMLYVAVSEQLTLLIDNM